MHHSLQIMSILPLMTGHLFWKATTLGGLYRGVPLYSVKHSCWFYGKTFLIHTFSLPKLQTHIICKWHLTHRGRVMHICISKLSIIGSDNGPSPDRCQAIIWTNAGILLIGPLGTNFNEILIEIYKFSLKKIHFKMSSEKWRPSCLGLNVLINFS